MSNICANVSQPMPADVPGAPGESPPNDTATFAVQMKYRPGLTGLAQSLLFHPSHGQAALRDLRVPAFRHILVMMLPVLML